MITYMYLHVRSKICFDLFYVRTESSTVPCFMLLAFLKSVLCCVPKNLNFIEMFAYILKELLSTVLTLISVVFRFDFSPCYVFAWYFLEYKYILCCSCGPNVTLSLCNTIRYELEVVRGYCGWV